MKIRKCESQCPFCWSQEIEWGQKEITDVIYQKGVCMTCECEFTEYYEYTKTEYDAKNIL